MATLAFQKLLYRIVLTAGVLLGTVVDAADLFDNVSYTYKTIVLRVLAFRCSCGG